MPYELRYHDLLSVPVGSQRPGIYWLRLYRRGRAHTAVLTEVPGNPALSVSNAIELIVAEIAHRFRIRPAELDVYEIWPTGYSPAEPAHVPHVKFGEGVTWSEATRGELESSLAVTLKPLPAHSELLDRVLSLGGGVTTELLSPRFDSIATANLPPPHAPFRCAHPSRFRRIEESLTHNVLASDRAGIAGQAFVETISPADLEACRRYHGDDWKAVADESVRIVNNLGASDREAYISVASSSRLGAREKRWLVSLFAQPIDLSGGEYTDGQHRACALRSAGAERAAVVLGWESTGHVQDDWIYRGDG